MALRQLRFDGDEILRKKSKEVKEVTPKIKTLVEDMIETMYENNGVGLAAPQIGILKRIFVVDIGEGPHVFINPEIIESEGEQCGLEGCLSIPGKQGEVTRPNKVAVKALDKNGEPFTIEAEEYFARAICHENDHLNGVLYTDIAENIESIDSAS